MLLGTGFFTLSNSKITVETKIKNSDNPPPDDPDDPDDPDCNCPTEDEIKGWIEDAIAEIEIPGRFWRRAADYQSVLYLLMLQANLQMVH